MKVKNLALLSGIIGALCMLASCSTDGTPAYKNPKLSPQKRTADLLSRMTVEEKVGQLLCTLGWGMYEKVSQDSVTISESFKEFIDARHGGMLWAAFRADPWTQKTLETGLNPELSAKAYNAMQKYAIENSRLGIPIILAEEAPHGHMAIGATVFPTGIGLASTWDTELLEEIGKSIAKELRAQGAHIGYGPVVDLAREPRWSRVEETYGEDMYLTSKMSAAMIRGESVKYNGTEEGIISTVKHFIAYGIPEGGHNAAQALIGERELYEHFLPVFKETVDAGAGSIMTSYNAIDGVPSTANKKLLTDVLKGQWNFEGFVVSDLGSIDGLCDGHRIATDKQDAAELAIKAGVDVDLGANCYPFLVESFSNGSLDMDVLDEAVRRVLLMKFELGLFDTPYVDPDVAKAVVKLEEHEALALDAAREGVILLENNGVLPLQKGVKVAVIGPNADNMYNQLGDYTAPQLRKDIKTVLDGIVRVNGKDNTIYVKGCAIKDMSRNEIKDAVRAARQADVAVVVVGGSSARDFETHYLDTGAAVVDEETVSDMECGEGFDRATLELMGLQEELLKEIKKTGTPMVVVYIEGRPLDKTWAKENADALLTAWYPGQEGGLAVAEVLFGEYNPSGRLPVSVPRSSGQLPVYYNKRFPSSHDYVDMSSEPLYEFGYGLSYTEFEYSAMQIVQHSAQEFELSFSITNTGKRDGFEVPQLYVTDLVASTARPIKQLRGFRRVEIPAGESVEVVFSLNRDDFLIYGPDMKPVVEPGEFKIAVGASSEDIRLEEIIRID